MTSRRVRPLRSPRLEVSSRALRLGDEDVSIRLGPDPALVYTLPPGSDTKESETVLKDDRERSPLEAFTALPIADMLDALRRSGFLAEEANRFMDEDSSTRDDQAIKAARKALRPLLDFVAQLGAPGVQWGSQFVVGNPYGDLWEKGTRLAQERRGPPASSRLSEKLLADDPIHEWVVDLSDATQPGVVRRRVGFAGDAEIPEDDRVVVDDFLPSDPIRETLRQQQRLGGLSDLAEALGSGRPLDCRDAARSLLGERLEVRLGDSPDAKWLPVFGSRRPPTGAWRPFAKKEPIDWLAFARAVLAVEITRELRHLSLDVGLNERGVFVPTIRARSLVQYMYLELRDQLEQRQDFGAPRCQGCGGVILASRRSPVTRNRWHPGCAAAGRQRRHRARSRQATGSARPRRREHIPS